MNIPQSVSIVTGSSSGVGAATARMLAEKGGNIVINYSRSADAANRVAAECEALGGEVLVCQADVSEDRDCRRLVEATLKKWGRIDSLVNNAGTTKFVQHGDLDGLDASDFQWIYGVNVVGPFQMVRAAHDALKASGDASVVNVASIAGVKGVGSSIAYAASKGALITMTQSLARVLGPEIRVNAVCPGFITGDWLAEGMGQEVYDASKSFLEKNTPLQTTCTPETVAESILNFIEGHSVVTGQHLVLDGGHLLL
ncbi:MAG: SDR family oxidoreductase [Pseudomonadales bacterium]|nr:SDR family oxidoreductase [Pseudomonadales bacterium]MBO6567067.1 SDR family oxidoreductase [Pseudomonadales bacterium]MBO6594679.1 SDR family oxidoreductase [Pseudomonadales bacterium]MBO6655393.1 SDR family oxidoreductase [Pseudomonadales bacterium]MBO6701184.1 SDR family oxidoreductase [Pseudomonadales bacterium]